MKSMTGYGSSQAKSSQIEVSVSIRSVNGRFLDSRFHLPKEYLAYESQLKKELAKCFQRGTVDIYIHRRVLSGVQFRVHSATAKKWLQAQKELAKVLQIPLNMESVLERISSLPQVIEVREFQKITSQESALLKNAFNKAIRACSNERSREGKSLQKHLSQFLSSLTKIVVKMEKMRAVSRKEMESRITTRIKNSNLEKSIDPSRMAQELILYLEKSDITEEIHRLKEHVLMCMKGVHASDVNGKIFDFYAQELLREINTIGSKANHAGLTALVVDAKSMIESFKEQVQNIE